ncbi:cytochrome b [Microvirga rosea]|uniref:cytochrome b n=1 Tax=Microvirga rosea TaxID=2715425 RepID=UPI001D09FD7E|nr:cytochrome b/b6 domain-containing protein [Microvirga rosea]MCB8819505.1 cytochrome b/b6 domain-containing protein [Microvirga rosea]
MSLKSTSARYGAVALGLHWACAALILTMIPLGFMMQSATEGLRVGLYRTHILVGMLIGLLTMARLVWWIAVDRQPEPIGVATMQHRLAQGVHIAFYILIALLTISGIRMTVASGLGIMLVTGDTMLFPVRLDILPPRVAHGVMVRILIALLAAHIMGALYHHYMRRDGTLDRMLPRLDR